MVKCGKINGLAPRSAIHLWNSLVRPILEYSSELWAGDLSAKQRSKVLRMQSQFLKGLLRLPQDTNTNNIMFELGFESCHPRWFKMRLSYYRRLMTMHQSRIVYRIAMFRKQQVDEYRSGSHPHTWMF